MEEILIKEQIYNSRYILGLNINIIRMSKMQILKIYI